MKPTQDIVIEAIIDSITDTSKTTIAGKNWFKFEDDELSTLHIELVFLLVAAVDFASFVAFRSNENQRSNFMDSFYEKLEDHYNWLPSEIDSKFYDILDSRISSYGHIISTYQDYDLRIAQFFANLLDRENDQEIIQIIRLVFMQQVDRLNQILANHFAID